MESGDKSFPPCLLYSIKRIPSVGKGISVGNSFTAVNVQKSRRSREFCGAAGFQERDWKHWQAHMERLIGRMDELLTREGETVALWTGSVCQKVEPGKMAGKKEGGRT